MKSNQIIKLMHLLRVFISIQLLIKVAWGVSVWGSVYQKGAKLKGKNYFTKIFFLQKYKVSLRTISFFHVTRMKE